MQNWTGSAAGAAVMPDGSIERFGPNDAVFALASITKLYTAMAALVAHEEGTLDLDDPFDEVGFNAADLLAHSAGIAPDERRSLAPPAARRIYSTAATTSSPTGSPTGRECPSIATPLKRSPGRSG